MRVDTIVEHPLLLSEGTDAKQVYVGSEEQPPEYDIEPVYLKILMGLIGSMEPRRLLEFGCHAGRNLAAIRDVLPKAELVGIDVNPLSVGLARELHNIDVILADEHWLEAQQDDSFDVVLSVSVVDHMPYPEAVLRNLLRTSATYLVLLELVHDRVGKTTHNLYIDGETVSVRPTYRYSYTHDYRYECEKKFGAHCILDAKLPIGRDNLHDLYRLFVFSKRSIFLDQTAISAVSVRPVADCD